MIKETITFSFDDIEQQRRFHERLAGKDRPMIAPETIKQTTVVGAYANAVMAEAQARAAIAKAKGS